MLSPPPTSSGKNQLSTPIAAPMSAARHSTRIIVSLALKPGPRGLRDCKGPQKAQKNAQNHVGRDGTEAGRVVENQLKSRWSGDPARIAPVKIVGDILAIGSGLALGREGPTARIGASIGHPLAKISRCNGHDSRVLLAAGAGVGLATAFNAPIASAGFVLEELVGVCDVDVTIATIGASTGAISVARVFLGQTTDFHIAPLARA
jgi:hypothetical protein